MIKKTVKYTDYNDVEQEETLYFNLSRAELLDMEFETPGGLASHLQMIVESEDSAAIYNMFKKLIIKSYGGKSADGKLFMKSEAITRSFTDSAAYSEILMTLCTDVDEAVAFVNGILPAGMAAETQTQAQRAQALAMPYAK